MNRLGKLFLTVAVVPATAFLGGCTESQGIVDLVLGIIGDLLPQLPA